ncbi:hypothetical protein VC116063_000421A, partial [Vibrio cholerae O1 str. 116063]
MVARR